MGSVFIQLLNDVQTRARGIIRKRGNQAYRQANARQESLRQFRKGAVLDRQIGDNHDQEPDTNGIGDAGDSDL